MKKITNFNRRQFLKTTGAALVLPTILPGRVFGADGQTAPSNKITMGIVGWGMQGPNNTKSFLVEKDCQVVAACDLDTNHLQERGEHHQRPLWKQGLQALSRFPRNDGAR